MFDRARGQCDGVLFPTRRALIEVEVTNLVYVYVAEQVLKLPRAP